LVPDDRLLIPNDPDLIREEHPKTVLITQDLLLVGNDRPLVRDDLQLILDCGLRHSVVLLVAILV
jgi:hypothetical protein